MDGNFGRPPGAPPAISGTDVVGALIAGILNQAGQQQPQVLLQQLLQVQQHLPLPPLPHNPPAPPQPHPHLQPPPAADPPAPVPPADPPKPAATGSTQLAGKDSGGKSPFDWSDDDLNIFILDLWYGDKMTNQRCAGAKDSKLYRDVVDAVMKWQTDNRKPAHQLKEEQVKNRINVIRSSYVKISAEDNAHVNKTGQSSTLEPKEEEKRKHWRQGRGTRPPEPAQ